VALVRRFLAIAIALIGIARPLPAQNYLYQLIEATVLVADPDRTADTLEAWVEREGGYALLKSSDRVVLRLPFSVIPEFRSELEELSDYILELSPQSRDLREAILETRAKINSRQDVLRQTLALLDQADVKGTLAIEKEVVKLIEEIEELSATLQRLNVDRTFSRAEISLRYLEQTVPENIPSSFDWINGVDFYSFIERGLTREDR
jgi:vacuolar-type H+-ATPase subunit I/STV1